MYIKIFKFLFLFLCVFFILGCSDENEDVSNIDPDSTDSDVGNNITDDKDNVDDSGDSEDDNKNESILTIEYEKVMYYGEELPFKVTSKYEDDEIEIESLNEDIVFFMPSNTNEHIIVAYDLGVVDVKVTSKYGEEVFVQISVEAKEGFAPPIEGLEIFLKEQGPYYVNEVYHIDFVTDKEIYNDRLNFLTSANYQIDLDTMEIVFTRSASTTVTCTTIKNAIKATLTVNVEFNPNLEMYDILFIGNSLTYVHDIPKLISNMIEADGTYIRYNQHTVGGAYLSDHKSAFNKLIKEVNYTHVMLQEQSFGPIGKYDEFRSAVLEYNESVKENGAKLVLYQTWGYNVDDYNGYDKYSMGAALKEAYQSLADETNSMISRVGDAFIMYEKEYVDLPSLYQDMNHQSIYGAYLSACVHYGTITGKKAIDNSYEFENIENNLIKIIKEIADKIVFSE